MDEGSYSGEYTGKLGYSLYKKYLDSAHTVYYAHSGKENDEPNLCHPTPFFGECSNASTLSWVDIAVVNKKTDSVELIAEIEESGAEPKKVIGDVVNIMLSEQVRINGKDYGYGDITFILGVKVNPEGDSEKKTRRICKKLAEINEKTGNKNMEIIPLFDSDIKALTRKVEREIERRLATT
ncbi:MAG: hypothetical protein DRN33_03750 [Thermoplasmata archaeon]|nr:MAG: hypothetical protein DRN33_03750 [Thermoplasmata archaeon]